MGKFLFCNVVPTLHTQCSVKWHRQDVLQVSALFKTARSGCARGGKGQVKHDGVCLLKLERPAQ